MGLLREMVHLWVFVSRKSKTEKSPEAVLPDFLLIRDQRALRWGGLLHLSRDL